MGIFEGSCINPFQEVGGLGLFLKKKKSKISRPTSTSKKRTFPYAILYFRMPHKTLCLSPKICINYCFQMLFGILHIPPSGESLLVVFSKFSGVVKLKYRVINVKSQLSRSLEPTTYHPQRLSSVEFPVTFSQFLLNCESICDPTGGDTLLAQGIYLTDYIYSTLLG